MDLLQYIDPLRRFYTYPSISRNSGVYISAIFASNNIYTVHQDVNSLEKIKIRGDLNFL